MTPRSIPIHRWLMQTNVWRWRILGFASAIVGLVCYALSSSFNHLFGDWNLLKVFLYCIFSFIICVLILYANIWQQSRSLRFKAHTAFLVLTITTVYSFFSDKGMNGKPDAYTIISFVAFSIMSLGLSKQTQCGFEVDLLYFFLGCLTVLLMKIKYQLFIVGAGFSYCLIILRYFITEAQPERDDYLQFQHQHPDQFSVLIDIVNSPQLSTTENASSMMEQMLGTCVIALQQENWNLNNRLFDLVNKYCEEQTVFVDFEFAMDALPSVMINEIHETVKLMVGAGFEKHCCKIYSSYRREFLLEFLVNKLLELQGMYTNNEHKSVEYIDMVIERWMITSEIAVNILFPIERRLCDRVFSGFTPAADACFKEVCQATMFQLLNFVEAVVTGSSSTWRLFTMLKMFEKLLYLIPKFQSLLLNSLVKEVAALQNRLAEAIRELFMEFDKIIFRVPRNVAPIDAGKIHPMVLDVMSHISFACRSRQTLEKILQEYRKDDNRKGTPFSFVALMEKIIVLLERKLVSKSKIYKDTSVRYLFMINNRSHIDSISKAWDLGTIFGDDWFKKNKAKIQQNIELYQIKTWEKVLEFLKLENNYIEEILIEKLILFNMHFNEICRVHSTLSCYDQKLRGEMIMYVTKNVLPAYGIFIGKLHDILGNHAYEHIDYGVFEIQDKINHLWDNIYHETESELRPIFDEN